MSRTRTFTVALATATATALFPAVAQADPAGSADAVGQDAVAASSQSSWPTHGSTDALVSSIGVFGSTNLPPNPLSSGPAGAAPTPGEGSARVVGKSFTEPHAGVERWTIYSPAMNRNIEVQIRPGSSSGPMLYLLDGVDAPRDSGWLHQASAHETISTDVTLVMPTGAHASMYADWHANDPALGQNQWETFLAEELPPLLERQLKSNGKRGIAGLSMGATGAVTIANAHPGVFDAVIGISGCYSPNSPAGRVMVDNIIGNAGASLSNLYGPAGAAGWRHADVVTNPSGLQDTAVYLTAAEGAITPAEQEYFADRTSSHMITGMGLEWGANSCARDLDTAMRSHGMDHQVLDLQRGGIHNWPNFSVALERGWDAVKHAL